MPSLPALDVQTKINESPHVVILGAGASRASFPNGDLNGKVLPVMDDLADVVGIAESIRRNGYHSVPKNFEAFYSDLAVSGANEGYRREIDHRIYEYFSSLRLPITTTIYDYLVLALRKTDLIATFNWDPFLAQAYRRNMRLTEPPRICFLHGNVEVGVCEDHRRVGFRNQVCSTCEQQLEPTRLLYPVKQKAYQSNLYIEAEWQTLQAYLEHAYFVTIFGYGAPDTDVEAKSLMLRAWKENASLELAEVDIVDIAEREYLEQRWDDFLVRHHYGIRRDIFESYLFVHPRRSCDAFAMATLQCDPWKENRYPEFDRLEDLHRWLRPLLDEEERRRFSGNPCPPL